MTVETNAQTEGRRQRAARGRLGWLMALLLISGVMTHARFGGAPSAASARDRAIPPVAQAHISAAIGKDDRSYYATPRGDGFAIANTEHSLSAAFTEAGVAFRLGGQRWNLALSEVGYGDVRQRALTVAPNADANRVEYRRGTLTEWYVNGPLGLEQGLTLAERPVPVGASVRAGAPLTLTFDLSGDVGASVDSTRRQLSLTTNGTAFYRYGGLMAWDATGRELMTWMDVHGSQLRLHVDEDDAVYPLTIDPVVQAIRLTTQINCSFGGSCDDGKASDQFGFAVAMSSDASTVVVGVPFRTANNVRTGGAYVFVKPPDQQGGWNSFTPLYFANKLMASDAATNGLYMGRSVAISADGRTIVAGAPGLSLSTVYGKAYVFARPTTGWGGGTTLTQTARLLPRDTQYYYDYGSFGFAVTISDDGSEVAAGAPYWTDKYGTWPDQGAAFAFWRGPGQWEDQLGFSGQRIDGSSTTGKPYTRFGGAVSLSGDGKILVIGAPEEDDFRGAAYMMGWAADSVIRFEKLGRVANAYAGQYDAFGATVSTNAGGSRFAVSAPGTVINGVRHGAVFVYDQLTGSRAWSQSAMLTSSDAPDGGGLGDSLSMSRDGNTVVAGNAQSSGTGPGAAYVFVKPVSGWLNSTENAKVVSPYAVAGDRFGYGVSVSANGATWLAGAPFTMINGQTKQGAAYVFTGVADYPIASVSPGSLAFGPSGGNNSNPKTVTVTNTGAGPLHVSSVVVQGPFTSTQNCIAASPIAPGAACIETVTYVPIAMGHSTGTLTFTDDSAGVAGTTQQVSLSGFGVKVATSTAITTVSANPTFVGVPVGVSYLVTPQAGSVDVPTGTVTVQASTGESCTGAAPSGTCTMTFAAANDRTLTATYGGDTTFEPSTSPAGSIRVVDFTLAASPASQTIASRKATFTIAATALNGFTGAVALGCSGGPAGTACALTPTSLSLSGDTLKAKASVTVPPGSPIGPYTITFTGTFGGVSRTATATLTLK